MPEPRSWVFVVGCYNSGTTLLHDVLAAHPLVGTLPDEGQFCTDQLPRPRDVGLPRMWAAEPERFHLDENSDPGIDVVALKRQWAAQFDDYRRPVLLEKSPTNAARTRWLEKHFQPARFIGIVRNGYAVAEGLHRKRRHPYPLAARQWAESNRVMLADFDHLQDKLLIRYEELTEEPRRHLSEIFAFVGLDAPDDLVGRLADGVWDVHKSSSPIRNMNDRSMAALTADDRRDIEEAAGPMLRRLGYL